MRTSPDEIDAIRSRNVLHSVSQLEHRLGLPPLTKVAAAPGCLGATRLYDCGEDSPDTAVTLAWHRGGAWTAVASQSSGPIRHSPPLWMPPGALPALLRTWARAERTVATASSCEGELTIGGPLYFHEIATVVRVDAAKWGLEGRPKTSPQCRLVRAYHRVCWLRWLLRNLRYNSTGGPPNLALMT